MRGTSMQAIAAAAGVAKGTLYNHFRTKDDVLAVLLRAELDRLTDLATPLPRDQALAALADELGAHPVLRRVADDEPEVLAGLLGVGGDRWADLTGRLAAALRIGPDAAQLVARWLLGVVLQPGRPVDRQRQAALLATGLAAEAVDGSVEGE